MSFPFADLKRSGRTYIGDSFGDRDYIDVQDNKPCSIHCHCRQLGLQPQNFAFIAFKDSTSLNITFYDQILGFEVASLVDNVTGKNVLPLLSLNGLAILAKYNKLNERLRNSPTD